MAAAVRPEVAPAAAGSPSPPRGHLRASRWWTLTAAAVVAVVLALPLAGAFRAPGAPMEEGKLLVGGELVLDGKVPHADFEHIYGPADVWMMAGSMAVLGHSVEAGRWLGLAYTVALIAGVFALGRRAGPVAAAGAAVVSGLFLAPFGVHAYSWTAGLALVLWGLVLALRCLPSGAGHRQGAGRARRERLGVASGMLLGLALVFRPDLVLAVVAVLAATAFGMRPGGAQAPRDRPGRRALALSGPPRPRRSAARDRVDGGHPPRPPAGRALPAAPPAGRPPDRLVRPVRTGPGPQPGLPRHTTGDAVPAPVRADRPRRRRVRGRGRRGPAPARPRARRPRRPGRRHHPADAPTGRRHPRALRRLRGRGPGAGGPRGRRRAARPAAAGRPGRCRGRGPAAGGPADRRAPVPGPAQCRAGAAGARPG